MAGAYKTIIKAVEKFLQDTGSLGPHRSKSTKEVVNDLREKIAAGELDVDVVDGTMINYISEAANKDENSGIVTGGPYTGYWYDLTEKVPPAPEPVDEHKIVQEQGTPVTIVERDLYPLMELWLQKKGYIAKDMSNLRGGGRWGNPDIIGADIVQLMGVIEVDLASCEVKITDINWEQIIFEAISHKRFSNRSWFCYRVNAKDTPLPKGIEYYAERYRVGVVQICLEDAELIQLKNKSKEPLDYLDRVIERIQALYDPVPLKEKRDVIERTGVTITLAF